MRGKKNIPPVSGNLPNDDFIEEEINSQKELIELLKEKKRKNYSPTNQVELDEAENRLKELEILYRKLKEENNPQSPPMGLIIVGGIIALAVIIGIGFLVYKAKKKS